MTEYRVQMAGPDELAAMVVYLVDLNRDNGVGDSPLFQPQPRGAELPGPEKLEQFQRACAFPVGEAKWRRFWLAYDAVGAIAGHVDLQAWAEPHTRHRAVLGMGVHRDHRRRGLGRRLLEVVFEWAARDTVLEWIDLQALAGNRGACALYQSAGFQQVAILRDKFRIDGESVDEVQMTRPVRRTG